MVNSSRLKIGASSTLIRTDYAQIELRPGYKVLTEASEEKEQRRAGVGPAFLRYLVHRWTLPRLQLWPAFQYRTGQRVPILVVSAAQPPNCRFAVATDIVPPGIFLLRGSLALVTLQRVCTSFFAAKCGVGSGGGGCILRHSLRRVGGDAASLGWFLCGFIVDGFIGVHDALLP